MINDAVDLLVVFVLAAFVGFEVISKVPSILHTPLMSGSNAIHGIILVGAMFIASQAEGALQMVLAFVAVFLATLNIVGGVVVTDQAPPPATEPNTTVSPASFCTGNVSCASNTAPV